MSPPLTFEGKKSIIRRYYSVLYLTVKYLLTETSYRKFSINFMKKLNRKKKRLLIICIAVLILAVLIMLSVRGVRYFTAPGADTEQGIEYIKAAESEDISTIEQKIAQLENTDGDEEDSRSNKEKFASSVVMGDAVTEGLTEYDVLNASSVVSKNGVHLDELDDQIAQAKKLDPQIIFLSYGMSDVIETEGETDQFRSEYEALVRKIGEEIPDAHIFVNAIFPVLDQALEDEPALGKISDYNEVLRTMCADMQIGFIDSTDLARTQYYEEDGIHFTAEFYPVWADRMAEVAAL